MKKDFSELLREVVGALLWTAVLLIVVVGYGTAVFLSPVVWTAFIFVSVVLLSVAMLYALATRLSDVSQGAKALASKLETLDNQVYFDRIINRQEVHDRDIQRLRERIAQISDSVYDEKLHEQRIERVMKHMELRKGIDLTKQTVEEKLTAGVDLTK